MRTRARAYVVSLDELRSRIEPVNREWMVGRVAPRAPVWDVECGARGAARPTFSVAATLGSQRGFALVDCVAYIGLLAVILTLAFAAFYRTLEYSRDLTRNAAEIARALQAGERWRADVRASTRPARLETVGDESQLHLASRSGEVSYAFRDGGVFRQALPNTNWVELLPRVANSRMFKERRQHVGVWRWEVELKGGQKVARVRPLFSFLVAASGTQTP